MNEIHYYLPALDIENTAQELFTEVRNGYRENIAELEKIKEILTGENLEKEAKYVEYEIDNQNHTDSLNCYICNMQQEILLYEQGGFEWESEKKFIHTFRYESREEIVLVSVEDEITIAAGSISKDTFLNSNSEQLIKLTNEIAFYNAIEKENSLSKNIDITKEKINCCDEIMITDNGDIEVEYELWFDVDEYFGTNTKEDESAWVNFYSCYSKENGISAYYIISTDECSEEKEWELNKDEKEFLKQKMEEYCQKLENCSLDELWEKEQQEIKNDIER